MADLTDAEIDALEAEHKGASYPCSTCALIAEVRRWRDYGRNMARWSYSGTSDADYDYVTFRKPASERWNVPVGSPGAAHAAKRTETSDTLQLCKSGVSG